MIDSEASQGCVDCASGERTRPRDRELIDLAGGVDAFGAVEQTFDCQNLDARIIFIGQSFEAFCNGRRAKEHQQAEML
jgi:hypothetical protein